MPDIFVSVPIETDSQTLADRAVENLQTKWPGWEPNDGDQEVVQIETLAPMAADCAVAASRMFSAAWRGYGEKIAGVAYGTGSPAISTATFHLTDTDGHDIPAGFELDVDGYAFSVDSTMHVPSGMDTVPGVAITATVYGSAQNDLAGSQVTPIGALSFVEDVTLDAPTASGTDPETDESYQNKLVTEQRLRARTLVVPANFEAAALEDPAVGRAVAIKGTARDFTIVLTDYDGEPVLAAVKTRLGDQFEFYKQVNTTINMPDATYTTVNISGTVYSYPGVDKVDLKARIIELLNSWFSPGVWGKPKNYGDIGTTGWYNEKYVRHNKVVDLIGDVTGVNYVGSDLTVNGSGGDITLAGTVALTRPGNFTGLVIA